MQRLFSYLVLVMGIVFDLNSLTIPITLSISDLTSLVVSFFCSDYTFTYSVSCFFLSLGAFILALFRSLRASSAICFFTFLALMASSALMVALSMQSIYLWLFYFLFQNITLFRSIFNVFGQIFLTSPMSQSDDLFPSELFK